MGLMKLLFIGMIYDDLGLKAFFNEVIHKDIALIYNLLFERRQEAGVCTI
jgi:hypothetical protein